jgi:hypothetical protein
VSVQDVALVPLIRVDVLEPRLNCARAQDMQCSGQNVIPDFHLEAQSLSQSKVSLYAHLP